MPLVRGVEQELGEGRVMPTPPSISHAPEPARIKQLRHQDVRDHVPERRNASGGPDERSAVEGGEKRERKGEGHTREGNTAVVKYGEPSETAERVDVKIDQVSYRYHRRNFGSNP